MAGSLVIGPTPDQMERKLRRLALHKSIKISTGPISNTLLQAWYRAARRVEIKVQILTTPVEVRLWRIG